MGEREVIEGSSGPTTVDSLAEDLSALGVAPGDVLLVHASLSSLGWVCGGPSAVILALEAVLGSRGTLVMPSHSGDFSDPADWGNPAVPADWWQTIRDTMPAYDAALTPTRGMGAIAEIFRHQTGVVRSCHPQVSFSAWGAHAEEVTAAHEMDFGLGEGSPLARLYDLDARVLLLGVGHRSNTSLHLAEYRAARASEQETPDGAPVMVDGRRCWTTLRDMNLRVDDFERIGQDFAQTTDAVRSGLVGAGQTLLMPQRALVDYAVTWMDEHREYRGGADG